MAVGDVCRQHRRGPTARLRDDAAAGTAAAVRIPAAVPRYGHMRRPDDVLDHAARAPADARRRSCDPGCPIRHSERGGRLPCRRRGHERRAASAGAGPHMSLIVVLAVGVVGGAGSVARLLLDGAVSERSESGFPYGTLTVNLLGAFALGVLAGTALGRDAYRVAGTGLIGAFTTFSTWAL